MTITTHSQLPPDWPTHWSRSDTRVDHVDISPDGVGLHFIGLKDDKLEKHAALARTDITLPEYNKMCEGGLNLPLYYFEVHIYEAGHSGAMSIGVAKPDVEESDALPGMMTGTSGWRADDGSLRCNKKQTYVGPKFGKGDVVGCGVDWRKNTMFYTKNGALVDFHIEDVEGPLCPAFGLGSVGCIVKANFGQERFMFDINSYINNPDSVPKDPSKIVHDTVTQEEFEQKMVTNLIKGVCKAIAGQID